jgi:hypothetical protein
LKLRLEAARNLPDITSPLSILLPADYREEPQMVRFKYHEKCYQGLSGTQVRVEPETVREGCWDRFFERTKSRYSDPEVGIIEPPAVTYIYQRVRVYGENNDRYDLIAHNEEDAHDMREIINKYGQPCPPADLHLGPGETTTLQGVFDNELGFVPHLDHTIDEDDEMRLLQEDIDRDPYYDVQGPRQSSPMPGDDDADIREFDELSDEDIGDDTVVAVDQAIAVAQAAGEIPPEPMEVDFPEQPTSSNPPLQDILQNVSLEAELKAYCVMKAAGETSPTAEN